MAQVFVATCSSVGAIFLPIHVNCGIPPSFAIHFFDLSIVEFIDTLLGEW